MKKKQFIIESNQGEQYLVVLNQEKTKDLSHDEYHSKIVDVLFEVLNGEYLMPEASPNQEYVGPRKGTTSPESSKLVSIFSTINPELREALISIEKYTSVDNTVHIDPMTQETTTIADVIEYNNNIPNQNLDPEHLDNRRFPSEEKTYSFGVELLQKLNTAYGLALNDKKINYFVDLFNNKYKRIPTFSELHIFAQANSEHCRHNIFNGVITIDKTEYQKSMFAYIKETYKNNPGDVVIAYADNGAVLKSSNGRYLVIKCETHNHPSMIEPFAGGATGSGGDYRDIMATGHGAEVEISTSAYCFGNIMLDDPYNAAHKTPLEILIKATRGVNYYGNCFAAPMINGSITAQIHDFKIGEQNISFAKPIVMAGAAGSMPEVPREQLLKNHQSGLIHIKLGGPDYKIGVGGAAASSMNAGENTTKLDFASVQRPDPQMQTKIKGVVEVLLHKYPDAIQNFHDYGAGGHGTNIFELAEGDENHPGGVQVDIAQISVKDTSMKYHEIMINESQERQGLLIKPEYLPIVQEICRREKCPIDVLGNSTDTGRVHIYDSRTGKDIVNIEVEDFILKDREYFEDTTHHYNLKPLDIQKITIGTDINDILRHPTVGSKGYLVNHVDRSVRGKVVQQQAVGPRQLPVADYAIFKLHQDDAGGTVTAQGMRPFHSIISPETMVKFALTEAVFNTAFAKHKGLEYLSLSGNWMRSAKTPGGKAALYQAVKALSQACIQLDPNIPVGKDSLSMQVAKDNGEKVDAPGAVILSGFVHIPDVNKAITPNLKNEDSILVYLPVQTTDKKNLTKRLELGLGGSIAAQLHGEFGDELPDIDMASVKSIHNIVQELIEKDIAIAGHDISEGGLYATLTEMYISGEATGVHIQLPETEKRDRNLLLMSELPGVVLQIPKTKYKEYKNIIDKKIESHYIGKTEKNLKVQQGHPLDIIGNTALAQGYMNIGNFGRTTVKGMGALLEYRNHPTKLIEAEHHKRDGVTGIDPNVDANFILPNFVVNNPEKQTGPSIHHKNPRVAILRDEGTNGHHDMRYIWKAIGCDIQDVTMTDLLDGKYNINDFEFTAGPGGFSYGDVPVSGRGVASVINHNPLLKEQFDIFHADPKKGSINVCNRNQVEQELGYITRSWGLPGTYPMLHNKSKQFESRFLANKIINDDNIWFKGMKGDILGLRSAHGEGQYNPELFQALESHGIKHEEISPIVFVDKDGNATEQYPYNPNGSKYGTAGIISPNGRHLSMMPHPERTVLPHQLPWTPDKKTDYTRYRIFKNAIKNS